MKYKPYPKYKESGVAWLGEVPEGWELLIGKHLFSNRREKAKEIDEQLAVTQKYGVIPQSLYMKNENQKLVLALKGTSNFRHVEKNDFVISLRSFQGGLEFSNYSGCVSPAYTVLTSRKRVIFQFYTYLFKSIPYIKALQSSTDSLREGKSITYEQFGFILLPLPLLKEQKKIANYLDQKTQKIDTLIEKQQTLIKLLKEKRQAVISHAVTKGLDNDISDWQIKKVKFNLTLQNKKITIDKQEVIALENIESKSGKYIKTESSYKGEDVAFQKGDILFGKLRPYLAKVFECKNEGVAFGDLLVFRPNREMDSTFVFYSMLSDKFIAIVDSSTYGTKMPRASVDFINEMRMSTPPLKEQKAIAHYLDQKTNQIDTLITKSTKAIELLKERRTALISAVVTGKVKVNDE